MFIDVEIRASAFTSLLPFPFIKNSKSRPTLFIDRDGVINLNRPQHVLSWNEFEFEQDALEALKRLRQAGFQIIVITNQAAIERGLASRQQIDQLHRRMVMEVKRHGGAIKAVLYCPHLPEKGCWCRKPRPGLLFMAANRYGVRLNESWFIGDYTTDIEAGLAAGCRPLLVLSGRGRAALESWYKRPYPDDWSRTQPLTVKSNLLDAANYLINNKYWSALGAGREN